MTNELGARPRARLFMHHLLDFLYEHSFDKELFFLLPTRDGGELELRWRGAAPLQWEIQQLKETRVVERKDLISQLTDQGADLVSFESELGSLVAAHIVVADHLLRAAREALGSDGVRIALGGHQQFVRELRDAIAPLLAPPLRLVR